MKSLTEIYTPLIKNLQSLNLEIRQRHSSMHSCTEQEMKNLGTWLEELQQMVKELDNISLIIKQSKVPVIVDAGIGTASDATIAMELGCDGVLINSAIANARKPILMAKAFKDAVISGRNSYLAERMNKNYFATASSPLKGLI